MDRGLVLLYRYQRNLHGLRRHYTAEKRETFSGRELMSQVSRRIHR